MTTKKKKPWNKIGKPADYDVIVIGSGMGGMVAAALLAKLGKRVLVLEQHFVPGGFTHVFKRKGYAWDVGVHAIGEVTEHSGVGRLLKALTNGKLAWASLGPVYDEFHFPEGFQIDFPDTPAQFRENLVEAFPDEEDAIDQYLSEVRKVAGSMRGYYLSRALPKGLSGIASRLLAADAQKQLERHTDQVIADLTDNKKLRSIFAAQWGYYGSPPSRSSFAMQALVVKHFSYGGYYPVGGSARIAEELLATVSDAGGWTRIHASVEEILVERGRAVGVRLEGGEEIRAAAIVSAAGVQSTCKRLLPSSAQGPWSEDIKSLNPASAHVCLYLGFKGDIREAGAGAANKWFYDTWDHEDGEWMVSPEATELPRAKCLYCSFPSLKDPTHEPGEENRNTGEVVTFVPYDVFTSWRDLPWKNRGDDYEAFKKRMTDQLLKQLFENMPGLESMLDYAELSTPLSTEHFVRPQRGSIYGLEPTPERFRTESLRPRSPIKTLYFAGGEVTSVGVVGAMMGGVLAVLAMEPVRSLKYLRSEARMF